MEAPLTGAARPLVVRAVLIALGLALPHVANAAGYRTTNFTVAAPSPQLAKEIGDAAEQWRRELAIEWLGRELPAWGAPCPIKALVAPHLGAGGATSFVFDGGEVFNWDMEIQGSRERVLDSVLPHEITHTIFASHFRQAVPRWADEGACTTVEHPSEIAKQERMLIEFLKSRPSRGIAFSQMFAMKEYPRDVLPLYAQGHSLARYLISQRGKRAFLEFLADGMQDENWPRAIREHYEYEHLLALQNSWMDWVKAGRPAIQLIEPAGQTVLASAEVPAPPASDARGSVEAARATLIYGGQEAPAATARAEAPTSHQGAAATLTPTPQGEQESYGRQAAQWTSVAPNRTAAAGAAVYDASQGGTVIRR